MVLSSKRGFLLTEVLSYQCNDRYSKKIGKIFDIIIHKSSFRIYYIVAGSRKKPFIIASSMILSHDGDKKTLKISSMKERLAQNLDHFADDEKLIFYTQLKEASINDIVGNKIGKIQNIAYHTGLKAHLITGKGGDDNIISFFDPEVYVIPYQSICYVTKASLTISTPKDHLSELNMTNLEELFISERESQPDKKRYVIVEGSILDILIEIESRKESILNAKKTHDIEIMPLNVNSKGTVTRFTDIFNKILLSSPDTYIPISEEITREFFNKGTFIAVQHTHIVGYYNITIQNLDEDSENIGVISGIGVHPNSRGKKIGQILFEHAITQMSQLKIKKIQADIFDENIPSLNLFSSFRFHEIDEIWLD